MLRNTDNIDIMTNANIETLECELVEPSGDQIATGEVEFKFKPQLIILNGKKRGIGDSYSFVAPYGVESITICDYASASTARNDYIRLHLTYSGEKISFYTEKDNKDFNLILGKIKVIGIG